MDRRSLNIPAIISYLSWPGWIIALIVRDPADPFAAHHLNQSLVLNVFSIICGVANMLPLIGGLISVVTSLLTLVLWIMGIWRAIMWDDRPLPVVGGVKLF